jgi:hypothetical protein
MLMMRSAIAVLAAALAAGLAGCASPTTAAAHQGSLTPASGAPSRPGPSASPAPGAGSPTAAASAGLSRVPAAARRVTCPKANPQLPLAGSAGQAGQPVPAGFSAVAVVECVSPRQGAPGYNLSVTQRRQVAVDGLSGLVAALRRAEDPAAATKSLALCAPRPGAIWFVLIGRNGQRLQPLVPGGHCPVASQDVMRYLNSLTWITLSVTVLPPVVTQDGVLPGGGRPPHPRCGCPLRAITPSSVAPPGVS